MRKLELLNHYLNGRFYEYIDKWVKTNKNNMKVEKLKYLKLKLLWDFNLTEDKKFIFNFEKYKNIFEKIKLPESQYSSVLSLIANLEKLNILSLLNESIMEFLTEEIWQTASLSELKEKNLNEKISKKHF